ncbi:MAG: S-layer family protein [Symploca sp. SIO2E9]|nr:S-layer family protein [Symploca sp. SIO2E9]
MIAKNFLDQGLHLSLASSLTLVIAISAGNDSAFAQITPDGTLGAEASVVSPVAPNIDNITGGAVRGSNLFHSFEQFNIGEGQEASFVTPTGIENILSRVTGGSISEILGILGVSGSANLFLINPNGIIFGQNANLNVNGSFVGTTANAIGFGEQGVFSASVPNAPSPLLTVNPSAFLFNQIAAQQRNSIEVRGSLAVPEDQSLLLLGGNVVPNSEATGAILIEGGILSVPGGRVELGAVAGSATVALSVNENNLELSYPDLVPRADISLRNGARVELSGEGSGTLQLQGRRIQLTDGSRIFAITNGAEAGGSLTVKASDSLEVIGTSNDGQEPSGLTISTQGTGTAAPLTIETQRLIIQDGATVLTLTQSEGLGGALTVRASDSVEVIGSSISNEGTINSVLLSRALPGSTGSAGSLTIETGRLIVQDGASVLTSTISEGQGGELVVRASDSVEVIGTQADDRFASFLSSRTRGTGAAGSLTIETRQLIVQDGAQISASTFGEGQGGSLTVTASDSVEVTGISENGSTNSGLFAQTTNQGDAGSLTIETGQLIVRNGGDVTVEANEGSQGNGGTLTVIASDIELSGTSADAQFISGLFASTRGSGDGGNIEVTTEQLTIQDGAVITVESVGTDNAGNAGEILINAEQIRLQDQGKIVATTESGQGGNIILQVQDLILLRRNSEISTSAGTQMAGGDGGDITINADVIVAIPEENSDITANAFTGSGGNINITTNGLFGIEAREQDLEMSSDITASSQLGVNGEIFINQPDVDPSQSLEELSEKPVDVAALVDQNLCMAGLGSEFIVTGRGGLPPSPYQMLDTDGTWEDWRIADSSGEVVESPPELSRARSISTNKRTEIAASNWQPPSQPLTIVEAQGWIKDENGKVVLTAFPTTVSPHTSWLSSATCQQLTNILTNK